MAYRNPPSGAWPPDHDGDDDDNRDDEQDTDFYFATGGHRDDEDRGTSGQLGPLDTDWRRRMQSNSGAGNSTYNRRRERLWHYRIEQIAQQETDLLPPLPRQERTRTTDDYEGEDGREDGHDNNQLIPFERQPILPPVVDDGGERGAPRAAPPTPPFGVQRDGSVAPPRDPKLRAVWDASPVGRAWANTSERAASARRWEAARTEWQQQAQAAGEAGQAARRRTGLRALPPPRAPRAQHGRRQPARGPEPQPGYILPDSQLAVALPEEEVVGSGGLGGNRLWDMRREEREFAHMARLVNPELGWAEKVPVSPYMMLPFRYGPVSNIISRTGVTPNVTDQLPPRLLTVIDSTPQREELLFALHTFRLRPHLQRLDDHIMKPVSMDGGGMGYFVEGDPLLRLLVAMSWVRLYLSNKLLAVAMNNHPDYAIAPESLDPRSTDERRFLTYFDHRQRQGTYFVAAPDGDRPSWQWQSWHPRYYSYLWLQTCRLLVPQDLITAQTANYLQTNHPPGPEMRYARVVRMWQERQGERYPPEQAWRDYKLWLSEQNCVPPAVIESRLDYQRGDWKVQSYRDYLELTAALMGSEPHLGNLAANAAGSLHQRMVVLWLMEPIKYATKE